VNSGVETPIGILPNDNSINISGLDVTNEQMKELFTVDKKFWLEELDELKAYFDEYVNESTPPQIYQQIAALKERISKFQQ
jgi:phosphoenolpyruvate carboxykinase (GTP)